MPHPFAELTVPTDAVAIHWFEQSSFALKDDQGTVLQIDPYFPHTRPADRFLYPAPPCLEAELPARFVLLTHNHMDHTFPESIERINQMGWGTTYIGPVESIDQIVADTSVQQANTITIEAGEAVAVGSMKVHAVYAKPPKGDSAVNIKPPDVTHLGYVVKASGRTLYFSGDPINTFAEHADLIDPIAQLQPEIGFLTNHPTEGEFPFFAGSLKMAQRIGLKHAVPAHYDCFVKRTYNPQDWAAQFQVDDSKTIIIPRNEYIVYDGS